MGTEYKDQLDLTFFTNDENGSLLNRFKRVLKTTKYFDILVGYFRASGMSKPCLDQATHIKIYKITTQSLPNLKLQILFSFNSKYGNQ
jgi:HKD family nuclease